MQRQFLYRTGGEVPAAFPGNEVTCRKTMVLENAVQVTVLLKKGASHPRCLHNEGTRAVTSIRIALVFHQRHTIRPNDYLMNVDRCAGGNVGRSAVYYTERAGMVRTMVFVDKWYYAVRLIHTDYPVIHRFIRPPVRRRASGVSRPGYPRRERCG